MTFSDAFFLGALRVKFACLCYNVLCLYRLYDNVSEMNILHLSYDVASGSGITPCNKIDKPLVVYRFTGNVMTSISTLRT